MKKITYSTIALGFALAVLTGCTGDAAPVEGDNPASANAVKPSQEQVDARGNPFPRAGGPPGSGRGGGNVMEPPK
jgi:hypothetical protein